jgi:hypothetical protein
MQETVPIEKLGRYRMRNGDVVVITERDECYSAGHVEGTTQSFVYRNSNGRTAIIGYDCVQYLGEK